MHVTRLLHALPRSWQVVCWSLHAFTHQARLVHASYTHATYTPLTRLSHAAGGLLVLNIPIAYASECGIKGQRDLGVQGGEGGQEKELLGGSSNTRESETDTRGKEEQEEVCKGEEKDEEKVAEAVLPILQALRTSGGRQRKVLV